MDIMLVLVGCLTVTSYRPVPQQTKPSCTDRFHCTTSIGENVSELGIAVSQDLLKTGDIHYGDVLYMDGYGYRIVNDTMAIKNHRAVDLFVYSKDEERKVGTRHLEVWVIRQRRKK